MLFLVLGVFCFGLTHPIGSILLKDHSSPILFSFLYILLRVLIQIPIAFSEVKKFRPSGEQILLILASGTIGTFLHWSEFASLKTSVPVSQITFLTFCFPLWIFIFEVISKRKLDASGLIRFSLAMLGLIFVIPGKLDFNLLSNGYIYPVISSLLLAMWMINSRKAQESQISAKVYSFYYDVTSLIGLLTYILVATDLNISSVISFSSEHISLKIFIYAAVVGVLPNILIFKGLAIVKPLAASFVMMFEPFISSFCSIILFNENFTTNFILGTICILLANIPSDIFNWLREILRRGIYESK
jgi:drug/metabolite transporter (DMT)-like permease